MITFLTSQFLRTNSIRFYDDMFPATKDKMPSPGDVNLDNFRKELVELALGLHKRLEGPCPRWADVSNYIFKLSFQGFIISFRRDRSVSSQNFTL